MNNFNFTDKTEETIKTSIELAREYSHVQVSPVHFACALVEQTDGGDSLFRSLINKSGGEAVTAERNLKKLLVKLPAQDPAPTDLGFSPQAMKVIRAAHDIQQRQKDAYISQDHLILALFEDKQCENALNETGVNKKTIEIAIKQVRGYVGFL